MSRAALLVERFAQVYRVGRKLTTMFVSVLSTSTLAPGLTPWFPDADGHELVVVDTNVARAVDALRDREAPRTYAARAQWVRDQAAQLDLREFGADLRATRPGLSSKPFMHSARNPIGSRAPTDVLLGRRRALVVFLIFARSSDAVEHWLCAMEGLARGFHFRK